MNMKELETTKTLKFSDTVSETVKFPNVKQFIAIEAMRVAYSRGVYGQINNQHTISSSLALDYIDAISTFDVLCPDLAKKLLITDFLEAELITVKKIVDVYIKQFIPWYSNLTSFLTDEEKPEDNNSNA